jgi:hypothetical protein
VSFDQSFEASDVTPAGAELSLDWFRNLPLLAYSFPYIVDPCFDFNHIDKGKLAVYFVVR